MINFWKVIKNYKTDKSSSKMDDISYVKKLQKSAMLFWKNYNKKHYGETARNSLKEFYNFADRLNDNPETIRWK